VGGQETSTEGDCDDGDDELAGCEIGREGEGWGMDACSC
jgi:hypothetical protein